MEVAATMTAAEPEHPSIVLRATHILRIRIDDLQAGEWLSPPEGWPWRSAQLAITLIETLKGAADRRSGEQFRLRVTQRSSGSPRRPVAPGVWSNQPVEPGTELLAFCHNNVSKAVENLLAEGSCEQIMPAEGNLADVRLALRAEAEGLSPAALADLALPQASSLGYLFADYLWAKMAGPALADLKVFESLVRLIETPELSLIARWALLKAAYSTTAHSAAATPEHVHRLALAFFRLLDVSKDPSVTDNIVQTFLPNLLGVQGGLTDRDADDVFRDLPEERAKVEAILRRYQGAASTQDLLAWLRASKTQP